MWKQYSNQSNNYSVSIQCEPSSFHPPEEFNDKILSPELSDSELQRLHSEVVHIYETYCLEESIDKISFDPFIVEEIRNSKALNDTIVS